MLRVVAGKSGDAKISGRSSTNASQPSATMRATLASLVNSKNTSAGSICPPALPTRPRAIRKPRARMQVVPWAEDRMPCLVADDEEVVAGLAGGRDKFGNAGVGRGQFHACAIDVALQLREIIGAVVAVEIIADGVLVGGEIGRDQTSLQRSHMKNAVVAGDGVVEVDPDPHGLGP